jgi:hypothetical protein
MGSIPAEIAAKFRHYLKCVKPNRLFFAAPNICSATNGNPAASPLIPAGKAGEKGGSFAGSGQG